MLEIIEYFASPRRAYWLEQIKKSDWAAGQLLYTMLRDDCMQDMCGEDPKVLLLTEGENLAAFCTYTQQDDIHAPSIKPWAGFVYTFPAYRGKRRMGKLLERAYAMTKADGYPCLHISTGEIGLYEKYGFTFWKTMQDIRGTVSRVYRMDVITADYSQILGKQVSGTVDRPLGSAHPRHPEMIYPVNYGYVDGVFAGDGAEQDAYIFGADGPIRTFSGTVVAVLRRLNDCEDKWIVSVDGNVPGRDEILRTVDFQEQYFMGELYTLEDADK